MCDGQERNLPAGGVGSNSDNDNGSSNKEKQRWSELVMVGVKEKMRWFVASGLVLS